MGYPTLHHHHPVANVYNDVDGNRTLQYKSVVKELEDSKLWIESPFEKCDKSPYLKFDQTLATSVFKA